MQASLATTFGKHSSNPGHINNLYNTTFWALVLQGGVDRTQAEEQLKVNRKNIR